MKVISYSLFKGSDPLAELFYVRGLYLNVLMNSIVYPGWQTVLLLDEQYETEENKLLFSTLQHKYNLYIVGRTKKTHCGAMLWRIEPAFWPETEYLICRDADALTSVREANAVKRFIDSKQTMHGISDNPAHSIPLLGGMCGFKCQPLRDKYGSYDKMLGRYSGKIDKHGSDQHFLNSLIYEDFKEDMMMHFGNDAEGNEERWYYFTSNSLPPKSHGSDLCTSFIGSAGTNEMETLRFFRDNLSDWGSDKELWEKYPKLFYWG